MITIENKTDLKKIQTLKNPRAIFVELPIYKDDIFKPFNNKYQNEKSLKDLREFSDVLINNLKDDSSLLFIYGSPLQLMKFNELVEKKLYFHYWIALDTGNSIKEQHAGLQHNHLGILLYSKKNSLTFLNAKNARFPHISCLACGNNVKDWGGKKHLMNKTGTGLSDVWKDLYKINGKKNDDLISGIELNKLNLQKSVFKKDLSCPRYIKKRIELLVSSNNLGLSELKISKKYLKPLNKAVKPIPIAIKTQTSTELNNKVLLGDCIEEMEKLTKLYPNGLFDLVFADPPYNLSKNYKEYDDEKTSAEYEDWCNRWIELCVKLTKPEGSIFILNIPKWGLNHAKILNKVAYFRNWIVWDALSTPKGKIMPAHYSLLYYTKNASTPVFNLPMKIDPISYCSRISCKKLRNIDKKHILNKENVSEIWFDVHRIKHKKNRDDHPCQLPHKMMDRIIQIFSKTNDLIFDPFGGAGTTGICAIKNERKFLLMELDPYYKEISEKRISETWQTGDTLKEISKKMVKSKYTKKFLETRVQELSTSLKRKPTMEEFTQKFKLQLKEIEKLYSDPRTVLKAGRIGLLNQQT